MLKGIRLVVKMLILRKEEFTLTLELN